MAVVGYIEGYYSCRRLHGSISDMAPMEKMDAFMARMEESTELEGDAVCRMI